MQEAYQSLLYDLPQQCLKQIRPDSAFDDDPALRRLNDNAEKVGRLKERLASDK